MESRIHRVPGRATRLLHVFTVPQTLELIGDQIDYAHSQGFEIRAIASPDPRLGQFGKAHDIEVAAVPMRRAISPGADLLATARLMRVIRSFRPHIVHSHTPKGGLLGTVAASLSSTPVRIYQMRGILSSTARGLGRVLFDRAERTSCRLAHHVICQSPSLRREALGRRLCPPTKCSVIGHGGNGIDATMRFNPDRDREARSRIRKQLNIGADDPVIGFVGRLVRDKGIEDLLVAWKRIRASIQDAHLLLVGPLEKRNALTEGQNEELVSDPRIHQTDLVAEVAPYYAAMDVLVLPSYREGLPNAPLEAAAMEIPVVVTRVTGCIDAVLDGETGTLVSPRDPSDLSEAISTYLRSPRLRQAHGHAGRQFVIERFSPLSVCERMHGLYERLLTERLGERLKPE